MQNRSNTVSGLYTDPSGKTIPIPTRTSSAQNCDLRTIAEIVYEVDAVLRTVGCG